MLEILETDEVGRSLATYVLTLETDKNVRRIDVVPASSNARPGQRLLSLFLPSGYPHTVSHDYTSYQVFDSLQAFSSSIAGLLASRAVLQGIGVGDENASATAAMLLSVLQESMGRVATIFFAHWCSRSIEAECKMYRLAADIFNDTAMIMDCLSPMFPKPIRVPLLCASSVFRALCGVAGGSSKAILSSHFAQADNIGELNAKDSSQETVISLLGMWVGGIVVSNVTSALATWFWLLSLLAIHISTNYAAVTSVNLRTLNRQRSNIVFSALMAEGKSTSPEQAARQERLFEKESILRWQGRLNLGTCHIGVQLQDLFRCMGGTFDAHTGALKGLSVPFEKLMDLFVNEEYLLWFDVHTKTAAIVLTEQATTQSKLKAWSHGLRVAWVCRDSMASEGRNGGEYMMQTLESTLRVHNQVIDGYFRKLEATGWNIHVAALETEAGTRVGRRS